MFRTLLARACVAVAVAPLFTAVAANAQPSLDGGWARPGSLVWSPCAEGSDAECTTIPVPFDWSNPALGATLDLAIGRIRASDPANRIGMLLLPNGLQGINSYVVNGAMPDTDKLRERFDIVSLDWRGAGRSSQIRCSPDVLQVDNMRPFPDTEELYHQRVADNAARGVDCRRHSGAVFDHVDADTLARDWNAIRRALGEPTMSLYAAASATVPAQRYAELFPDRLRALVLDTPWAHSISSAARFVKDFTAAQEDVFEGFDAWCDRSAACALHDLGLAEVWEELYAAALDGRLRNPTTGALVTADRLQFVLTNNQLLVEQGWPVTAQSFATMRTWLTQPATARTATAKPTKDEPTEALEDYGTFQPYDCENFRYPVSGPAELHQYRDLMAEVAPHTKILYSLTLRRVTQCLGWPAEASFLQRKTTITGTPPVLAVVDRHDQTSPYEWAKGVADQFDNAVTLEFDGYGFVPYFNGGTCPREKVQDYLFTLRLPAEGTHCPAVFPPDQPTAARQSPAPGPQDLFGAAPIRLEG
jgi:pimeloyl-ACP methyl ester carboxylesterase